MDTYILKYYHGNQKKNTQERKETFIVTYQITENNNTKKPSLQLIK